jgi:hypothetical protein
MPRKKTESQTKLFIWVPHVPKGSEWP